MPTYDYKCPKCKTVIEAFHNMSENPRLYCKKCGTRMIKLISGGAGLIFKGDGFYRSCDYINQKAKEDGMTHGSEKRKRTDTSL